MLFCLAMIFEMRIDSGRKWWLGRLVKESQNHTDTFVQFFLSFIIICAIKKSSYISYTIKKILIVQIEILTVIFISHILLEGVKSGPWCHKKLEKTATFFFYQYALSLACQLTHLSINLFVCWTLAVVCPAGAIHLQPRLPSIYILTDIINS